MQQKESILQSVLERNFNKASPNDQNYMNVKNTIASTSSKKTSNNTSWLVSTSSRNASITPRKIITKVVTNASPELNQNQTVDRFGKTYLPNSKIQRNKIRPKAVKLSSKHKIIKEKSIRASSGSNRNKLLISEQDALNNTGSKVIMDKDSYQKIINELGKSELKKMGVVAHQGDTSMPDVSNKNNLISGIYGSFKAQEEKHKFSTNKNKEKANYNAHPTYIKKGLANRNILKAKMEIRTNSDSNENEYNLILSHHDHFEKGKMVFSPVDVPNLHALPRNSEKTSQKTSSLKNYGKIKQKHTGVFSSQENINKKFLSRNDPYQNALSDKTVIRTSSEKRVNNNFSKTFEKDYISKSIARNMSWEDSSTGRKNEKTFSFINKTTGDVRSSDKYTWNLRSKADCIEVDPSENTKISANIYKKSTKGKTYDKTSSKHSIKWSGTSNKLKLKLKKNGFFDDSEQVSSNRAEGRHTDKIIGDSNFVDQCRNSNANTDRGHYQNLLITQDKVEKPSQAKYIKNDARENKIKKTISKNKIENLRDDRNELFEKPRLEIQVDSIIQTNSEFITDEDMNNNKEFKFKSSSANTIDVGSDCHNVTNGAFSANKTELSKEAQNLMSKLNIMKPNASKGKINNRHQEEEKGDFYEEEFDQSRPMTTRIYENDDDQHLFMQYKNLNTPNNNNKHLSVEAGLERRSKEDFKKEDQNMEFADEQYSMIIKNVDEEHEYAFASPIHTPTQDENKNEETNFDEDVMTVIENDWDNEYEWIFTSLKDLEQTKNNNDK